MGFVIPSFTEYRWGAYIEERRPIIGDEAFEALRAEGRKMPLDEVIALALNGPE